MQVVGLSLCAALPLSIFWLLLLLSSSPCFTFLLAEWLNCICFACLIIPSAQAMKQHLNIVCFLSFLLPSGITDHRRGGGGGGGERDGKGRLKGFPDRV